MHRFPSEVSLESLMTPNKQTQVSTRQSNGSLRSSPSLASYDKISLMSNRSFPQRQQSIDDMNEKVNRSNISWFLFSILKLIIFFQKKSQSNHLRASSASSFLTKDSISQGYMSAQASPTTSLANCTFNPVENDTLIAKVRLVGRDELVYKKIRVSHYYH